MTKVDFTHYIAGGADSRWSQPCRSDHFRLGLLFAIGSAFAFGCSGPFAKALMDAGWSPTAAVTARLAGGAVVMAVFATIVRPGWLREALQPRQAPSSPTG